MQKPPKNLTLAQLDKEFADLRWKIAQQLGMYDIVGTISYAKSSVNLDPGHAERWDSLGDLCNLSGEVTSAIDAGAAYKKALAIEPARHETRLKLACAYLMMERPELAIKHIEYYLCGMDEKADPQAIGMYASTCALAGETARGIVFCKARLNSPQSNRYRIACAILENADGHRDIAVDLLAKVEKNEGDSSPLSAYAANLRRSYVSAKGK
jgi:thioredoxin-like negative regulator of GroEL